MKNRQTINLSEFAETYLNLKNSYPKASEKEIKVELGIAYDIHGNTVNNLLKRAKGANLLDTKDKKWETTIYDEPITEDGEFFTYKKSTLYGSEGEVKLEWVKSKVDEKKFYDAMQIAIKDMMLPIEGQYNKKTIPTFADGDLCTFYPLVDMHLGMLVDEDIGDQGIKWNLDIAEENILSAMEYLVNTSPASKTCIITDLGDFLHTSDDKNRSQSGHVLNASDMHYRVVRVALTLARKLVEMALRKHEIVYFYTVKGNHSEYISVYLQEFLSAWFRDEPRVVISSGNQAHKYFQFNKVLLGFTHHISGTQNASEVMIFDNQNIISDTKYRYYHMGHVHHNRAEQGRLVTVECHQNLPVRDAWASSMGFRGTLGQAKSITYHKDYGEVSRNIFNIQMID